MLANGLITMYAFTLSIGTSVSSSTWTYSPLAAGIENISEALNETVQQYFFMSGEGFATNHVTGAAPAFTVSGRRVLGDTAQDYICGLKYQLDGDRVSSVKIEYTDASNAKTTITAPCTISNIVDISGATTEDSQFSCEIRIDGEPTVA